MRNLKLKLVLGVSLLMSSVPSFAAMPAQSLALTLSGTVASACSFSVNSVNAAQSPAAASTTSVGLSLTAASETPANAAVVVTCNDMNGYVVTAASLNNGSLKSATTSSTIAYKMDLDSATPQALTTAPQSVLAKASLASPETAVSHPLRMTYTAGIPNVLAGTYSDTITLTLTGN
jgi:spore coat protein U-like protein